MASGTNFKKMLGVEMTGKKTDRHGEAGDARAGATKPSPPPGIPHGLCYRFSSRGLLHR